MIVKMLCTFEFNPQTNEYTPIGEPEIVKTQMPKKKKEESDEPQLELDENKYHLNTAAIELLNVQPGDKIDIKYQIVDKINYPIIGPSSVWNSASGNKLTKSGTVSYRGKANITLAEYGSLFNLIPWQGHEGLFVLISDEPMPEPIEDDNVEIPVDDNIELDIKDENTSIDDLLDDIEEEDTELKEFKFKF